MKVQDLVDAMERIAPTRHAEVWDNVGLLVGSPEEELSGPLLLAIDLTEPVIAEAVRLKCGAVLAYHPPIFHPLRRLTTATGKERVILRAARAGIAVYSPHTAIDSAPGGMTDWLADGLLDRAGIVKADRRALGPRIDRENSQEMKIVTFVPAAKADDVRAALASAGAGIIGNYELCSFTAPGTGTFLGKEGARPAVGAAGRLETVAELRLEMVCSRKALALAIATLKQFHPYEQPAIDVYELLGKPERTAGLGRRLVLDQPASLGKLAERLKTHLEIPTVKVAAAAAHVAEKPLRFVGVCPGAGADLAPLALSEGCEVYVTGEMKHHEVMVMLDGGMSVILAGHTNSERGYLPRLRERVLEQLKGVKCLVSREDRSPFTWR
jgi:dinuclear metal center YbgI/SA1388 family protein